MEEIRLILNNKPTKWGKAFYGVLEELEITECCRLIQEGSDSTELYNKLKGSLNSWWNKVLENEMLAILNSSYNMLYKEILLNVSGADYWDKKVKIKENKEVWARIRCGCVGRAYKKGFKDWSCRLCNWGEETLTHLIRCPEAWKLQSDRSIQCPYVTSI